MHLGRAAAGCSEAPFDPGLASESVEPDTRYALLDGDRVAYQVVGDGPVDLVLCAGVFTALDATWAHPEAAAAIRRLADHCRFIMFDQRGVGASDVVPLDALPPLEARWDEVRAVMEAAERDRRTSGRPTLLFVDEIHRFNRAQQDAFLQHVERGHIVLVGATTENPSFEVNAALLSRCRVYVLNALQPQHVFELLRRAVQDERGLGGGGRPALPIDDEGLMLLAGAAQGDARAALNTLEILARDQEAEPGRPLDRERIRDALQRSALYYDKAGEEHFNLISALHKSLRNSDADAALYWLARMLEAGEDALYVARRLVRFASEDVGLADPRALLVANAAKDAAHFVGRPEGDLALAQAAVYLAQAPKSNAVYRAWGEAVEAAHGGQPPPVPLHLRNAPTSLMRGLGYGRDYDYAHDHEEGVAPMECLPEPLLGRRFYRPTERGYEAEVARRLERARQLRKPKPGLE